MLLLLIGLRVECGRAAQSDAQINQEINLKLRCELRVTITNVLLGKDAISKVMVSKSLHIADRGDMVSHGMKWENLMNLSSNTKIALYFSDEGNSTMKSTDTNSHEPWDSWGGTIKTALARRLVFAWLHTMHFLVKVATSIVIPFQL